MEMFGNGFKIAIAIGTTNGFTTLAHTIGQNANGERYGGARLTIPLCLPVPPPVFSIIQPPVPPILVSVSFVNSGAAKFQRSSTLRRRGVAPFRLLRGGFRNMPLTTMRRLSGSLLNAAWRSLETLG